MRSLMRIVVVAESFVQGVAGFLSVDRPRPNRDGWRRRGRARHDRSHALLDRQEVKRCDCFGALPRRRQFVYGAKATRELGIKRLAPVVRLAVLAGIVSLLSIGGTAHAQSFATIPGNPLRINVGSDLSFQVFNTDISLTDGQIFPGSCQNLADMGIFVDKGGTLYAPHFNPLGSNHCHTYTSEIGANSPWTILTNSPVVTGTGTCDNPYTVVIQAANAAVNPDLQLTMTARYVNGDDFFLKTIAIDCFGNFNLDLFLGGDLYLATEDNGFPVRTGNAVGGIDCVSSTYQILYIPKTPEDHYVAGNFATIWSQIGSGPLSDTVANSTVCDDNGAALQWGRTCTSGATVTVEAWTSFGEVVPCTKGACCFSAPCSCLGNQTEAACIAVGGIFQGNKTICANDICDCLMRACCDAEGNCDGDFTRAACEVADFPGGPVRTWHIEASCVGAGGRPPPQCNRYDINNCVWDNGLPLDDGGASRAHTHSAGGGLLPRYDFNTADDFILRGPDSIPCQVSSIRWYMRARPSDTTGPVLCPPDPAVDLIGVNVTIFENYIDPNTGLNSPAGFGKVPFDESDLNPKLPYATEPGGIVYARTFCTGTEAGELGICPGGNGSLTFTLLDGDPSGELGPFCDPPPPLAFETQHVYQVDITIDPPILLCKNRPYWLDVQGLLPFNDGLRDMLQTWWMPSQNNTGFRGMTQRTNNRLDNFVWHPTNVYVGVILPGVLPTPQQPGNQGAPCAGVPANTRLDYAFRINGAKDAPAIPNDLCMNATEVFDGTTAYDNTGAGDDLPVAVCGASGQDIWYKYTATCTGVLKVSTCGSDFDSIVVVYDGQGCAPLAAVLDCGNNECDGNDASAMAVVSETGLYLIRVAGVVASQGKGNLTIECHEVCGVDDGDPLVNNCCVDHSGATPPRNLGCEIPGCCEAVCAIAGEEGCCDDLQQGWDTECAWVAHELKICQCPCLFTCPGGSTLESEPCGQNTNGGCDNCPGPEMFESPLNLVFGSPRNACGTVHAAGGVRDTDWWQVNVPASASGLATLNIVLNGNAPVGLAVLGRLEPADVGGGETFCIDRQCTGASSCEAAAGCTDDGDCPPGETCIDVCTTLREFDSIATASCQATDGLGGICDPLVACVPAPGTYILKVFPAAPDNDGNIIDGIFHNLPCGARDDYSFRVTASNDCTDGACCTFNGTCTNSLNEYECFLAGGSGSQDDSSNGLCIGLPAGHCADLAHGCASAQTITCNTTTVVNLTTDDHLPEEPYPCALTGRPCTRPGINRNDRWWGKFVAPCDNDSGGPADDCNDHPGPDTTSVALDTCTSVNPGRDSVLGIYGTCCPAIGMCPSGRPCDPNQDFCGGGCSATEDFAAVECSDDDDYCGCTGLLSRVCAERLIEGETYYVQLSNWAEPVNGIYNLRLTCPCYGGGSSCCFQPTGICMDNITEDECQGANGSFSTGFTCATLPLACGVGACCAPDGTCTNTTLPTCPAGSNHNLGAECSATVCNIENTCDYNTGDPTDYLSQASFGFRSQYAEDIDLFVEIADQFEMTGDPGNGCLIDTIIYTTFHTSHDTDNGCQPGGGGSNCLDSPSEYEGIIVTISQDVAGNEKGPTCEPDCTTTECMLGPDGDYHTDSPTCQSYSFGPAIDKGDPPPPGNYWEFVTDCSARSSDEGTPDPGYCKFFITLHFHPPLFVMKNQEHWLAITHVVPEISRYSVIWLASVNFNGAFSQVWSSFSTQDFEPLDATPNDQLFAINGAKEIIGCPQCKLHGDVVPSFCLVDVDDLLCLLDAFVLFPADPSAPCSQFAADIGGNFDLCTPDGGVDSTDILGVLGAFVGTPHCPAPCNPGACDLGGGDCRDQNNDTDGMSEGECNALGGTYCGDCKLCGDACDGVDVCP